MQSRNLGMSVLFVAQLGAQGPLWAKGLGPWPTVGYRTRPKAQPIRGLGWVGPGPTWALMKPIDDNISSQSALYLVNSSAIYYLRIMYGS
jgi:hypothetical protein